MEKVLLGYEMDQNHTHKQTPYLDHVGLEKKTPMIEQWLLKKRLVKI